MLNILLDLEVREGMDYIEDVNSGFMVYLVDGIQDTVTTKKLLMDIDGARYYNRTKCLSRFGVIEECFDLSTGCKAAILVSQQNKPVSLKECGINVRDAIIKNCTSGTIIMYNLDPVCVEFNKNYKPISFSIDVSFMGKRFTDILSFNDFLVDLC